MRRLIVVLAVWTCLGIPGPALVEAALAPRRDAAEELLETLTPEERIGQLFLVTFRGSAPSATDAILELIQTQHVGGVVLRARNDNFVAAPDTVQAAQALIARLQTAGYEASLGTPDASGTPTPGTEGAYIPLFIAISQEGDGAPYSEILSGMTELPSEMAIGATWDPSLAQAVGAVLGRELGALGFNLLLGPSLDVLESPRAGGTADLGVRAFGGDPYWVSLMGEAFITGVHAGSGGRVAVVAKHFPGHGGSDRPLEEEVATVRKSLEQLERIELAPFFAVTSSIPGMSAGTTDALLTSPIRYQGFQENIRATTRPVSLDPVAFGQLMALEPLASWRSAGGVTMSDSLGSRAIRGFYDPREEVFRGPLVARDAFLAGNDLLYLGSFQGSGDEDMATTVRDTLAFFVQRFREDPLFAEQVNQSVLRILRLKMRVYGSRFSLDAVLPDPAELAELGFGGDVALRVARAAATLISPSPEQVADRLPNPPRLTDRIVFFTDVRLAAQCTRCEPFPTLATQALESTILRLYGPAATEQVGGWNLTSYSMADLAVYFGEAPTSAVGLAITPVEEMDEALRTADWLIFAWMGRSESAFGSNALELLLDRRPDLALAAETVVFAFGPPYDLDATDVSKLDAYYGLHARGSAFVEVAARLLFEGIGAVGASPVSIEGIGDTLLEATSPDPGQVITLSVRGEGGPATSDSLEGGYTVGDGIVIATGGIVDHNGHQVPDGTVVDFNLSYPGEAVPPLVLRAVTADGVAHVGHVLDRFGLLVITATSDPARSSEIVQLDVQEGTEAFVTVIAPSPVPTGSQEATPAAPTVTAVASDEGGGAERSSVLSLVEFMTGLMAIGGVCAAALRSGAVDQAADRGWRRGILVVCVTGLMALNYVAWEFPGVEGVRSAFGGLTGGLAGLIGAGVASLAWWLWRRKWRLR
jgi:beta-N-acetylhexosaminidase